MMLACVSSVQLASASWRAWCSAEGTMVKAVAKQALVSSNVRWWEAAVAKAGLVFVRWRVLGWYLIWSWLSVEVGGVVRLLGYLLVPYWHPNRWAAIVAE